MRLDGGKLEWKKMDNRFNSLLFNYKNVKEIEKQGQEKNVETNKNNQNCQLHYSS